MSLEVVTDTEWTRPIPRPDAVSAPYWDAAARGELVIQECKSCGHRQFYPRAVCTDCGGDVGPIFGVGEHIRDVDHASSQDGST